MDKIQQEDTKMSENGNGFSFGDALLTQAMTGFRGGCGGGCGGSNGAWFGGGAGGFPVAPYADLSTVQHTLQGNRDIGQMGIENIERTQSFGRVCDKLAEQNNVSGQNMLQLTGSMADGRAESAQGFSSVLLELCKCCKDGQILTIQEGCKNRELSREEGTKTRELFLTTELRKAVDQNNITATVTGINTQANANTQAIIQAIQGIGHHPHHPH